MLKNDTLKSGTSRIDLYGSKTLKSFVESIIIHVFANPRGALPYKPIRDVPFFRVSFFSISS